LQRDETRRKKKRIVKTERKRKETRIFVVVDVVYTSTAGKERKKRIE